MAGKTPLKIVSTEIYRKFYVTGMKMDSKDNNTIPVPHLFPLPPSPLSPSVSSISLSKQLIENANNTNIYNI